MFKILKNRGRSVQLCILFDEFFGEFSLHNSWLIYSLNLTDYADRSVLAILSKFQSQLQFNIKFSVCLYFEMGQVDKNIYDDRVFHPQPVLIPVFDYH